MKVIFALASFMFLASIGTSIPNVALPTLAKSFSVTSSEIQWVIISSLLANTISIVFAGKLGDHFGRQKVIMIGIVFYTLSAFISGISQSFEMLIVGRVFQGLSSSLLMALSVALVSDLAPQNKLGRSMGLLGTSSAIGTACGPSIGGLILSMSEWRMIFFFIAILGSLFFTFSYLVLPKKVSKTEAASHLSQKVIFKGLLTNLFMNVCVSTVMMSTLIAGPFFLTNTLFLDAKTVGLAMTVGPLMSILSGFPAGKIADKIGPAKVVSSGLVQLLIGALSFAIMPHKFGLIGYIISAMILSPGYQMFQAANNSLVMKKVPENQRGVVSGYLSLSRNLGLLIGASLMGKIYFAWGLSITFFTAALIALFALAISTNTKKFFKIILIGSGATLCMDLWALILKSFGITGLKMNVLGKWILSLIDSTDSLANYEMLVGWLGHYFIGITFCFLLVFVFGWKWVQAPKLKPALAIGIVTVLAPLLILQPALGLGYFASLSDNPFFHCFKSLITHTVYGIGLFLSAIGLKNLQNFRGKVETYTKNKVSGDTF